MEDNEDSATLGIATKYFEFWVCSKYSGLQIWQNFSYFYFLKMKWTLLWKSKFHKETESKLQKCTYNCHW